MRLAALAVCVAMTGCATGPMTQEQRDSSERTIRALQIINASPWGARQPAQQQRSTAYFKRSYVSGMNQICIYEDLGGERAITIGATQLCPLSL